MSDSLAYIRDMAEIEPESMILVDNELAMKYAEATLEQDPATGSIYEIRDMSIQNLDGTFDVKLANGQKKTLTFHNEQVYVAPLEYRDFFKWRIKRRTPGYILVSAQKQNVVYFVTEVEGKPLELRYMKTGYFRYSWDRHLRKCGYMNVRFEDPNIELDNHGRPYMVVPVVENTSGYTCKDITKVIIMDVQNGDVKDYTLDNLPQWVDRVFPSRLIEKRIKWWGKYKLGWWNAQFNQLEMQEQTPGIEQVYTNGSCFWYTGIQSIGKDDATSGFMLTDTRTGKSKYYLISGVNEEATRVNINNCKIEENPTEIHVSRLLMYNIENVPTYVGTCKNNAGMLIGYALVSVKDRNVCGLGVSIESAYEAYSDAITANNLSGGALEGKVKNDQRLVVIKEIAQENKKYYFHFEGEEYQGKEFMCLSSISTELKWTHIADSVFVSFNEGKGKQISIVSFDNLRVN